MEEKIVTHNGYIQEGFNKKKNLNVSVSVQTLGGAFLQKKSKIQCLRQKQWPEIENINAWMLSSETATFMKWGGLGMVASELPENFNRTFKPLNHKISIVTPLYLGDTGKKKAVFDGKTYFGAENKSIPLTLLKKINVSFVGQDNLKHGYPVEIYHGVFNEVDYLFIKNETFFSINPSKNNPSTQDGCYILNEYNIDEVERFAFFSKAVYEMLCAFVSGKIKSALKPNIVIANDWHSGAFAGLCKYLAYLKGQHGELTQQQASEIDNLPIVYVAHHLGYQGWDYKNTARLINALYGDLAFEVFKNAKAVKNNNPRTINTLIVYDCYNQASAGFHLADRVVTVSKNYMEEVSKELGYGYDFRDILKIRKNHRSFFGIVNGYDKNLITPNANKIMHLNTYFQITDFKVYDEGTLKRKTHNKKECLKLLSEIATAKAYKESVIPLIDTYKFEDISKLCAKASQIPFVCATSRLVEQKGYDIAAQAILQTIQKIKADGEEFPVFVLGGAGDMALYETLKKLKDDVSAISPKAAERIFVFRGYKDEFAYALQLAADFYLMPSRFEPCGLTQMEAMAKGALPVATSTGGLVDTIEDGVDGFRTEVFFSGGVKVYGPNLKAQKLKNNANAYAETLYQALKCFHQTPDVIKAMKFNAMKKDFSWNVADGSVYKYYKLFKTGAL